MPSAPRAMTKWATKGLVTALAATALLLLSACGPDPTPIPTTTPTPTPTATPPPAPIDLVPADANLVANVELGRILADADLASAFESAPLGEDGPASLEDALAEVEAETGIDLRVFSRIVVFGVFDPTADVDDQMGFGPGGDFGILARGTFDSDAILDRIRLGSDAEFREDEYRDHALLIGAGEDGSEIIITVLADGVFVLGTLGAVTSVIDVLEDGSGALGGLLLDTYDGLGDPLVKLAFAVPPGSFDDLSDVPVDQIPIPFEPSLLSDIEVIGFSGDKQSDLVTIELLLEYTSAGSAEEASDYFDALLTVFGPFLPPGAAADLLEQIVVAHAGSTVTITFSATVDQLTAAGEEMGALDESGLIPG